MEDKNSYKSNHSWNKNSWKCLFMTVYYTLRYPKYGLFQGLYLSGHDYEYTGEVHFDHWEMRCSRCSSTAGSEIGPDAKIENVQ